MSGAGTGAAIGSVVPGIGTGVGAAVGGTLGLLGGAFSAWNGISKARAAKRERAKQLADMQAKQEAAARQQRADAIGTEATNRKLAAEAIQRQNYKDIMDHIKNTVMANDDLRKQYLATGNVNPPMGVA